MPRPLSQHAVARRAHPQSADRKPRRLLHQGVAAIGVSALGLALAASGSVADSTQHRYAVEPAAPQAQFVPVLERAAGVQVSSVFSHRDESVSRSGVRASLPSHALDRLADQRADSLTALQSRVQLVAQARAVEVRAQSLTSASRSATRKAARIEAARLRAKRAHQAAVRQAAERKAAVRQAAARKAARQAAKEAAAKEAVDRTAATKDRASSSTPAPRRAAAAGHASLPITAGYHLAARFGDTGAWARHHTGLDFAAPMGTTVRAMAAGEVTHAGSGRPGWAGHYVTIRHADGKTSLYAHLSTVSVDEGERVSGGERIGALGMTGRTFGPHVHVELYPRGERPGDVYRAIDPSPWMRARGVRP